MKINKKLSVGAVVALGLVTVPSMVVHADEGIVTNDFSVKDTDGKVVKEFKSNEVIKIEGETEKTYQITIKNNPYYVEKVHVLKTIKHEEESLSIAKENMTLKTTPDIFGNTLLEVNEGQVVHRVDEVAEQNGFVKVRTSQNVEGWVLKSALKQNIRNVPVNTSAFIDNDSQKSKDLFYGDSVTIVGFESNQYKVAEGEKQILVNKDAISFTEPPKRIIKPKASPKVASISGKVISHNGNLADRVIDKAYQYMGVPYVWGGTTPNGFDCSGFTQYVLGSQGVSIPRVASDQARVGQTVDRSNLQKGDLIFFTTYKAGPSHVGFYIGNGQFIHAGGDRVQVSNIHQSYWAERYLFAKRMF